MYASWKQRLIVLACLLSGCAADRTTQLVAIYHKAEPPDDLFIKIDEARYLGAINGYSFLYYDFAWGTADNHCRGTQDLLVFNRDDRYIGFYNLGGALDVNRCSVDGQCLSLVYDDGETVILNVAGTPPEASNDESVLYCPAEHP